MSANPFLITDDPNENPFDTVILGGDYLPGLASVGKPKRVWKWDKKEAPGTAGDSITYRGSRLVDFVIKLTFWEPEQVDEWDSKSPGLIPDGKKALDIIHPTTDRLKVRSVVIAEIVELYPNGDGSWSVEIGVDEYKPPPKVNATSTPKGSSSNAASKPTDKSPTAKTEQEKEIARLLEEAKKP